MAGLNHDWHVVLGAGPLGLNIVGRLTRQGRQVRLVTRSSRQIVSGVETVCVDASDAKRVHRVCQDAMVLYFCACPAPGMHEALVPLVQGVTEGVARAGCRLVYADNMGAYGSVAGPVHEGLPHQPVGGIGRVRAAAADHIIEAHRTGRIAADVIRSSDLFGPGVTDSLLGERVFEPTVRGGSIHFPGGADVLHSYTYVDDFGRAMVAVAGEAGSFGQTWHVPSARTLTNRATIEAILEAGGHQASCQFMPGWLKALSDFFNRANRDLRESAHLLEQPWVVQAERLADRFGFLPTPLEEAIRATVEWYRLRLPAGGARAGLNHLIHNRSDQG